MNDAVLGIQAEGRVSQVSFDLRHRTVTSAYSNPNFVGEGAVVLKHRAQMRIMVDDLQTFNLFGLLLVGLLLLRCCFRVCAIPVFVGSPGS